MSDPTPRLALIAALAAPACGSSRPLAPSSPTGAPAGIPFVLADAEVPPEGCFAWSPRSVAAACRGVREREESGGEDVVVIEGGGPAFAPVELARWPAYTYDRPGAVLRPEDRARLVAELERGEYVALDPRAAWMRPIAPGGVLRWSTARGPVSVTFVRTGDEVVQPMGRWMDFEDRLVVRCGAEEVIVWSYSHHDWEPDVAIGLVPDGTALLLTWFEVWGIEGATGSARDAGVFDLAACAEVGPGAP